MAMVRTIVLIVTVWLVLSLIVALTIGRFMPKD
jgi:hypothetical protein